VVIVRGCVEVRLGVAWWRVRDPLACTSFSLLRCSLGRAGNGGVDRGWLVGPGGAWLDGRVADDVVPQGFPSVLRGPVSRQVQHGFAGGGREAGAHVDQVAAQGATGPGVVTTGEGARGAPPINQGQLPPPPC
jgi:hypothetical protein